MASAAVLDGVCCALRQSPRPPHLRRWLRRNRRSNPASTSQVSTAAFVRRTICIALPGRLAGQNRDSAGSLQLRLVHHSRRPGPGRGEAAHRRGVHAGRTGPRVRMRRKSATSISRTWTTLEWKVSGIAPLKDELARIDAIATPRDVARYIGRSQRLGMAQPFAWFSASRQQEFHRLPGRALPERAHHARP